MNEADHTGKIDILLVDDRRENLLSLEVALRCPQYNLIKTGSGDEALRYLLNNTPALILMDVQMPDLNGFEVASIIKSSERTRDIPIIFVTAINKDEQFVHQGYDRGAVDYIHKPYDVHILRSKVAIFSEIRRQHERVSRLVSAQQSTTAALAEFSDINRAMSKVLESICTSLEWDAGTFWKINPFSNMLHCHVRWQNSKADASRQPEGLAQQYAPGVGLPGRVCQSRSTVWSHSKPGEENLTAVGIPISFQDETLGVLELTSSRRRQEDSDLVRIMEAIGSQIGQALKRTESLQLVSASEARKTAILETALDCIISIDQKGRIVEFNPASEATFGYAQAEVIGKEMTELLFPAIERELQKSLLVACGNGESSALSNRHLEVLGMRRDGSCFPAEFSVVKVSSISPPLLTVFFRDITERKKSEQQSAFLAEASRVLSSSLNYEETFSALANLSVKSLSDWCSIHLIEEGGLPRKIVTAHSDPSRAAFVEEIAERYPLNWNDKGVRSQVVRTGSSELLVDINEESLYVEAKDQKHLHLLRNLGMKSVMIVPLIARKKVSGLITFVYADSGRKYTPEDLLLAEELGRRAAIAIDNAKLYRDAREALRTRDEFFSIASHELKTPITSLKMLLQVTRRGVKPESGVAPTPEKIAKALDSSTKQVDRLSRLVDDLLDVVRIRAGKMSFHLEEFDLSNLVEEIVEQYRDAFQAARSGLELKIEEGIVGLWDHTRIEQIIVNLISNTIKYAPGSPVKIFLLGDQKSVRFIVQDFGPGIQYEQQSKIFERFERVPSSRNVPGLGLGLYIVKQIVEAHGGTIGVSSNPGSGSTFTVELPRKTRNILAHGEREIHKPSIGRLYYE